MRCGACLNIFDARSHFLVEQRYLFDAPPPEEPRPEAEIIEPIAEQETTESFDDIYPVMMPLPTPPRTSRTWATATVLALLLIPVQLFYWQPEPLLSQSWYQEFLRGNCNWLPCEWPDFQDLEYLSLTGLVQPSSTHKQVLTALVELRNQAPLPQPFPSLSLRFMNIRRELVSARVFEPREYLQSEASGRRYMQPNQRVQIELQIYDPGGDAISYEFEPLYQVPAGQR